MAIKIKSSKYVKLSLSEGSKEYAELREKVAKAGILNRDYGFYSFIFLMDMSGILFCIYEFYRQTYFFPALLWGLGFSFFSVHIGGIIHDAGHRAIFNSSKLNDAIGYFAAGVIAFAYTNWRVKHNMHHSHTNEEGSDPDVEIPFSFTEDRFKGKGGIVGFFRKYQVYLYYPVSSLAVFSMRFKTLKYYLDEFKPVLIPEISVFLIGVALWYIVPFFIFPLWKSVMFLILGNPVAGFYLMNVFAPNHKGMPQIGKGVKFSFLEQQIITSRNIYGHWMTDFVYLGLNYQIEHHLFPNCPRNKLKLITPFVREICARRNLDYTQVSVIDSNRFILSELNKISKT